MCRHLDSFGLAQLARDCDAITTEFENVPAIALENPGRHALRRTQRRVRGGLPGPRGQKAHFEKAGVPCAPHAVITNEIELATIDPSLLPGILKTSRMGYDGKGQVRVRTP